jgi:hypothetical protein
VLSSLKQVDLAAQDVVKIEKILKDRGLVETIVKRDSKEAELVVDYLRRFWDYDQSPYIADKRSHGAPGWTGGVNHDTIRGNCWKQRPRLFLP